eukprot:Stramenopile-MAST_4_protein_2759
MQALVGKSAQFVAREHPARIFQGALESFRSLSATTGRGGGDGDNVSGADLDVFGTFDKDTIGREPPASEGLASPDTAAVVDVIDSEHTRHDAEKNISIKTAGQLSGIQILTAASKALRGNKEYQDQVIRYRMNVNPRVLQSLKQSKVDEDKRARLAAVSDRETTSPPGRHPDVPEGGFSPTDVNTLRQFLWSSGKIKPRRQTGLTAKQQRQLAKAIKQARQFGLLPSTYALPEHLVEQFVPHPMNVSVKWRRRPETADIKLNTKELVNVWNETGGDVIRNIARNTSTKIKIADLDLILGNDRRIHDSQESSIRITGTQKAVEKARKSLQSITSIYSSGDSIVKKQLAVPKNRIGAIRGARGNVRYIAGSSEDLSIHVGDNDDSTEEISLTLTGTAHAVDTALISLQDLLEEQTSAEVVIDGTDVGVVLGKECRNVNRIAEASGAYLQVLPCHSESSAREVKIFGTSHQVQKAKAALSLMTITVDVGAAWKLPWLRASVMYGGQASGIASKHGVSVRFDEGGSVRFVGAGKTPESVEAVLNNLMSTQLCRKSISSLAYAQDENTDLRTLVRFLGKVFDVGLHCSPGAHPVLVGMNSNIDRASLWAQDHFNSSIELSSDQVKFLVGKNGSHIRRLNKAHGIETVITARSDDESTVYFYGDPTAMSRAKDEVEKMSARLLGKGAIEERLIAPVDVGYNWSSVNDWTGAFVEAIPGSNEEVLVSGRDSATLNEVKKYIMLRSKHSKDPLVSTAVTVRRDYMGQIFGAHGTHLSIVHVLTGADLKVDHTKNEVVISGPEDQVEHAERLIRSTVTALSHQSMAQVDSRIVVPITSAGALVGGGDLPQNFLSRLAHETGTRLEISADELDERSKALVAYGAPEQVAVAVDTINDLLEQSESTTRTMELKDKACFSGALLGLNGENIREIEKATKTIIKVLGGTIEFHGDTNAVENAQKSVEGFLESLSSQESVRIRVPVDKVGEIVGQGGKNLRSIRNESGATRVRLSQLEDDWHANHIEIQGTPDQIKAARMLLDNKLKGLEQEAYEIFLKVPKEHVGFVLGKNGNSLREVGAATGTKIHLLPPDEKDNYWRTFAINGKLSNAQAAEEKLQNSILLRDEVMVEEEINISEDKIGILIGRQGANIALMQVETGASIKILKDRITRAAKVSVAGTPTEIEKARELIKLSLTRFQRNRRQQEEST